MKTKYIILAFAGALLTLASCIKDLDTLPMNEWDTTSETAYGNTREAYIQGLAKLYYNFTTNDTTDLTVDDAGASELIRSFWSCQEVSTDEVKCAWGDTWAKAINTNTWDDAENSMVYAVFVRTTQGIAFVNEYLRQTAPSKLNDRGVDESLRKEIDSFRAEAKFLRAYFYWMAMDMFGNVPFSDENSNFGSEIPKQKPSAEIYEYVVSELEALAIDPNMPEARSNRPRADKGSVLGLLARVYLNAEVYADKEAWTECKNTCEKIFALGYTLCPNYEELFRGDNGENFNAYNEFLFYANYDETSAQSWGGGTFLTCASVSSEELLFETNEIYETKRDTMKFDEKIFNEENYVRFGDDKMIKLTHTYKYESLIGVGGAWLGLHIHDHFVQTHFQPTDVVWDDKETADFRYGTYTITDKRGQLLTTARRTKATFSELVDTFSEGWGCYKYNNIPSYETGVEYWERTKNPDRSTNIDYPLVRLGEIYLIYAEACAHLGQGAVAQPYVNQLTERAGLLSTDEGRTVPAAWNAEAMKWFREERGRELYWEGHRRTDLIRYDSFSSANYVWPFKAGNPNPDPVKGVTFSSHLELFAYPASQIKANPDWKNPKGY